jgi:hypothetical protein
LASLSQKFGRLRLGAKQRVVGRTSGELLQWLPL